MACKMLFFDYQESEEKFFKENKFDNFEIKFFKESLNDLFLNQLTDEDFESSMIISVSPKSKIDDNVVSKFKNLRIISTRSSTYDHIDLNLCVRKNIALINVDSYGSKAVAQFTWGLIIMLVRKICISCKTENNPLIPKNFCGRDLDTLTLGIIGTGIIGESICKYAKCFGMRVLAYDTTPNRELVENYNVEYINKDDLIKFSDIITIHIPYTKDNYHMFSYEEFKNMKFGSYFINVARGEFVDTQALLEVVKSGKLKGIALDVIACPNKSSEKNVTSENCSETFTPIKELSKLPNVILTPHIAADTQESVDYILKSTFESLADFLQGGRKNRVF